MKISKLGYVEVFPFDGPSWTGAGCAISHSLVLVWQY